MGEEGRQCVFCFEVAEKQGGTVAGVQSTRVSSQARVPASRVNQATLARGADSITFLTPGSVLLDPARESRSAGYII